MPAAICRRCGDAFVVDVFVGLDPLGAGVINIDCPDCADSEVEPDFEDAPHDHDEMTKCSTCTADVEPELPVRTGGRWEADNPADPWSEAHWKADR